MPEEVKILIKPKLPLIIDGRGYRGTRLLTRALKKTPKGVLVRPTLIRLTEATIAEYNFEDDEFSITRKGHKAVWIDIPKDAIILMNDNPNAMAELLTCTFRINYETPISDREHHLTEYCNTLHTRISQLQVEISYLLDELEKISTEKEEFFKTYQRMREIVSREAKKDEEEEDKDE